VPILCGMTDRPEDAPGPPAQDPERAAGSLAEREAALERVIDAVPGGIVEVLPDGGIVRANAAAQAFLGLAFDPASRRFVNDFAGHTWWEDGSVCPVEDYPVTRCMVTGEPQGPATIGVEQPNGTVRWAVFTAIPVPYADGRGAIVTFLDLTERKADEEERKRIQAHLQLADRLASLGTLAAGVAHEINNPLTYVIGNLHRLAGRTVDTEGLRAIAQALEGAERVRDIVKNLNRFTRWDAGARVPFEVDTALDAAIAMAHVEWRHRARIERTDGSVPPVAGNEGAAVQVFVNLIVNAAQALPPGRADLHRIAITSTSEVGWVVVTVSDNGPGMDAETLAHALDPFFTTKPFGEGTGLGLSISHALVTSMGGTLTIDSGPGRGTTVCVRLPASGEAIGAAPANEADPEPARPGARILVIDDEPDVREVLQWFLEQHRIAQASDGREALERMRSEAFDVVLCDLMMPEVTGMDVYRGVQRERPGYEARIVFMTGGAYTEAARAFLDGVRNPVLVKPFDRRTVLRVVDRVLGGTGRVEIPPG